MSDKFESLDKGEWSACSQSCREDSHSRGIRTRRVTCDSKQVTVDNSKCDANVKPPETDVSFISFVFYNTLK